jgi:hypothetical protein
VHHFPAHLRKHIPNLYAHLEGPKKRRGALFQSSFFHQLESSMYCMKVGAEGVSVCSCPSSSHLIFLSPHLPLHSPLIFLSPPQGVVFLATRHLQSGDELLSDYRLSAGSAKQQLPPWYVPFNEEEARLRWTEHE